MDASQQAQPPSLPTEVIHRIIQLALPDRVSFESYGARYATLLRFMRVEKCWMELARREMLRHVGVGSEDAIDQLIRRESGIGHSLSLVKSLQFLPGRWAPGSRRSIPFERILELVRACPRLVKLQITPEDNGPAELHLGKLSTGAAQLQELVIDFPSFHANPSAKSFSSTNLVSLTLAYFEEPGELAVVLSSSKLPNLKLLVIILIFPLYDAFLASLAEALLPYASQLEIFGYLALQPEEPSPTLPQKAWVAFTSLKHLLVELDADLASSSHLGSSLTTLRFHPPFASDVSCQAFRSIHTFLSNNPMCCRALHSLSLPSVQPSEDDEWVVEGDEAASAARDSVLSLCARRGIEAKESRRYENDDAVDHREAALDF